MVTEILEFPDSSVSISVIDSLIYIKVYGAYDDAVALALIKHLDPIIDQLPEDPTRVWDASGIPGDRFTLTNACIQIIGEWADKVKIKKPGSKSYMLAPSAISFGMARMYGSTSNLDQSDIIVLHGLDELPLSIRVKIPTE